MQVFLILEFMKYIITFQICLFIIEDCSEEYIIILLDLLLINFDYIKI